MKDCIVGMLLTCPISKDVVAHRTKMLQQTGLKGCNFYLMVLFANMMCLRAFEHMNMDIEVSLGNSMVTSTD